MTTSTQALLDSLLVHKSSINLATTAQKNQALSEMALALEEQSEAILAANQLDMADAQNGSISEVMLDRLLLTPERIEGMAAGIRALIELPDPVGRILEESVAPNGM